MSKSQIPRLLVLDGAPLNRQSAGGVLIRELCRSYPVDQLVWFGLIPPNELSTSTQPPPELDWIEYGYAPRPVYTSYRFKNRYLFVLYNFIRHQYIFHWLIPQLVDKAVEFGRRQRVEMVLAILNHPASICMAQRVASELQVPLVTNVQDPPEALVYMRMVDYYSRQFIIHEFAKAIRHSTRCSTASENMRAAYKEKYGVDSVVLIHGVCRTLWQTPRQRSVTKEWTIGFAGNLYASGEWKALLQALDQVNWCIEGRMIKIRILSNLLSVTSRSSAYIEFLGWRPVPETIRLMAETDMTYLPYWFDSKRRLSVELCFPNKMSTYLAAGTPLFYHGPKESSVSEFLRRYPAGVCCHSLNPEIIISDLSRLIANSQFYVQAIKAGQDALEGELSLTVLRHRFAALIGINPDLLYAPQRTEI